MELIYSAASSRVVPEGVSLGSEVEILPIVDPGGKVLGKMSRTYAHGGSRTLHPVVHLHIVNPEGRLYLQKRSLNKDLLPGYWDTAVGGHVAFGEQICGALRREAGEELGLKDFAPEPILRYVFEGNRERELVHVFVCRGPYEPTPDHDEVSEGRWWCKEEILSNIGKGILTPNLEREFLRVKDSLRLI